MSFEERKLDGQMGLLTSIAGRYGVSFSEIALTSIRQYLKVEAISNEFLDNQSFRNRRGVADAALLFLKGSPTSRFDDSPHILESLRSLKELINTLSSTRRGEFLSDLSNLLDTTIALQSEENCGKAINLRKLEAKQALNLAFDVLPEETLQQTGFTRFRRRFERVVQAENLRNTYVEFDHDMLADKMSVKYNRVNRLRFRLAYFGVRATDIALTLISGNNPFPPSEQQQPQR